jgi:Na+-transporting methylmalonyl-CoA/oxaloacetate decarboxylase gamma subunit
MGILHFGLLNRAALLTGTAGSSEMSTFDIILISGIALVILLLIIVLAFLGKVASNLPGKTADKQTEKKSYMDNVIDQIVKQEEADLRDNNELVAVITAAVQSYMKDTTSANGFVVRSIRRVR